MSQAQFTLPLILPVPGQLITAALWTNEFQNIAQNLNPSGVGAYMDTTTQAQIQTAPYPSSILSLATSLGGEIERLRYQLAALTGNAYWYQAPATSIATAANVLLPLGGVIDYHSATPPNANFLLANGQAIGRSAYAALNTLYSGASYPFGSGDGSTTFNLPNYTDKMSIAAGNLYALAATGGSVAGALSITDPGHNHTQNSHTHTMGNHTHSTPASSLSNSADATQQDDASGNPVIYDGTRLRVRGAAGGTLRNNLTNSVSAGTTGTPSTNTSDATTPTNNSNTTGISGTAATLPPYLGMYKLIRVL